MASQHSRDDVLRRVRGEYIETPDCWRKHETENTGVLRFVPNRPRALDVPGISGRAGGPSARLEVGRTPIAWQVSGSAGPSPSTQCLLQPDRNSRLQQL